MPTPRRRAWTNRLRHAETALAALTPPRGRGRRQITDEATRVEAIDLVLKVHRVEGLLSGAWEQQVTQHTQYLGRGRGSASRPQRGIEQTRYPITRIARQEDKIAGLRQRCGWKAFVTNARPQRLSLKDAVLCYRNEYRVERVFNRLKSRLHIAPLFVKLNDQIEGLTYLLTLGVRVSLIGSRALAAYDDVDGPSTANNRPWSRKGTAMLLRRSDASASAYGYGGTHSVQRAGAGSVG
jgi:transposase